MAIKKVKMYTVVCDHCKYDIGIDQEYSCWNDANFAEDNAINSDWIEHEENHYCNDCYDYDDDDNILLKESRKNKYLNK